MRTTIALAVCLLSVTAFSQKAVTPVPPIPELVPAGVEVTVTRNSVVADGKKIDYTARLRIEMNISRSTGKFYSADIGDGCACFPDRFELNGIKSSVTDHIITRGYLQECFSGRHR